MNRSRSSTMIINTVLLCTVNIIFAFIGIVLNSVVIVSLLNSQLRRKLCYFMIFVLACFDLAVVVVFHPFTTVEVLLCWTSMGCDELVDEIWAWLGHLFAFSMIALLTMTVERYLASMHPFFHRKWATKSRLMMVIVAFLLPEVGIFVFLRLQNYLRPDNNKYIEPGIEIGLFVVVFFVISGINIKLFYLARTLRQRADIPLGSLEGSERRTNAGYKNSKVTLASLKKISTCLLAIVCLSICYCPYTVITGMELTRKPKENKSVNWCVIKLWAETFVTLNSSLNCLIFFYKNSVLRRHAMNRLGKYVPCAAARLWRRDRSARLHTINRCVVTRNTPSAVCETISLDVLRNSR